MPKFNDLTGQKFSRLTVLGLSERKDKLYYWKCLCECGNIKEVYVGNLKSNRTNSCGCLAKELSKERKREMDIKDLTGEKFNRLKVTGFNRREGRLYFWNCICECGETRSVQANALKTGTTKSCGCLNRELAVEKARKQFTKHGLKNHPIYRTRTRMITRCFNEKSDKYKYYGGRGITICQEWLDSFERFYEWAMNNGWENGLTIERKDVNGNYCPENCCWIPFSEQAKNKRNTIKKS